METIVANSLKTIQQSDVTNMMKRYLYSDDVKGNIENENLLPAGLIQRMHNNYSKYSGMMETYDFIFTGKENYSGLKGFREIVEILSSNGIEIGHIKERECFIEIYRFMATRHVLNNIDWKSFSKDSLFQLVFPQPGMVKPEVLNEYLAAKTDEERQKMVDGYIKRTNPHDGKQMLNKPWFENKAGELEFIEGSQHKYPQCMLIFDKSTQNCFAFCTYCFRHAQVRGDEDMFIQNNIDQIHEYVKIHKEITDMLITGGDAGYITYERLEKYVMPLLEDPELMHIRTLRLGTRVLSFNPKMVLESSFNKTLDLFEKLIGNGIQVVWMAHFSTPHEVMNPTTIAAIRRLRRRGIHIKIQSPIMNHISLFMHENGKVDIDRSAQNWIDLGNIIAMLGVGFHSIYCARPTGEHHYFAAPLADIQEIFSRIFHTLPSINRPSRFITMTSSAGKTSLLGTTVIKGEKVFVLKFNQGRNMEWIDRVFLAKYDEQETVIENLKPYEGEKHFYVEELHQIENNLEASIVNFKKSKAVSS